MALSRVLRPDWLVAAFLVGMLAVWLQSRERRRVYVFPSPDTVDAVQYSDAAGGCFAYRQQPVACPAGGGLLRAPQLPFD